MTLENWAHCFPIGCLWALSPPDLLPVRSCDTVADVQQRLVTQAAQAGSGSSAELGCTAAPLFGVGTSPFAGWF